MVKAKAAANTVNATLAVAAATLLACNGSDGGVAVVTPTALVLAGEWGSSATEVLDSCGFDPVPSYAPILIEEHGPSVVFTVSDGSGLCEQSVRARTGDTVSLTQVDTFDGGCGIVQVESAIIYHFTGSAFSGTSNHHYSLVTGACANLPCDYNLAVAGSRCDACFPGCVQ